MKQFIFLCIVVLSIPVYLFAQDKPFMECHYAESYKDNLLEKEKIRQDEMILRISKSSSEFFSLWRRSRQQLQDSMLAKGASLSDIINARDKIKYPISMQFYTIYKNYPQKGILTHTDKLFEHFYLYTEKMQCPKWKIENEKKTLAGYSCQKAVATFLGRKWVAWFTPDIPVQEGPWKLWGLPGLIIQAEDADKDFSFICIEIKKIDGAPINIPKKNYIKCDKAKYIKELTESEENKEAFVRKQGGFVPIPVGENGKSGSAFPKMKFNYLER